MNRVSDFRFLFLRDTPLIDLRAPVEFSGGSAPGAVNLPLLLDQERHEIGIAYKQSGQQAAIALGHKFVSGEVREARMASWLAEIERHPNAVLYCFRGGLRSQITQEWLRERGVERPIVEGGYKALRRFLLRMLEERVRALHFRVVCGPTGSGKTQYLRHCKGAFLDLEALARHRGSAFGALPEAQPCQVDFENALALSLLKLPADVSEVLVEDESRMIGKLVMPEILFERMKEGARLVLDLPLEERVENVFRDYVSPGKFADFRGSVRAISRKLGGQLTSEILADLDMAEREFLAGRGLGSNRAWIRKLLEHYYDPCYSRSSSL
jgi:tRNA 2-selenouridine synthase